MSPQSSPKRIHQVAHTLRVNPTEAEAKLWAYLRRHQVAGVHFRRQFAIDEYVVDFCSRKYKLIIELDGSQHLSQESQDQKRTTFLVSKGYRILRFWNNEVTNNLDHVIVAIELALKKGMEED